MVYHDCMLVMIALVSLLSMTNGIDYIGGWLPSAPKEQCVDICVNAKPTPTCPTQDPSCLAKKQRAGDFDYLVLEQLFIPQFCRDLLHGVDPTISHHNVNPAPNGIHCDVSVVKSEMTIHGLWPNYNAGYAGCCNVSETISNHPYNAAAFAANHPDLLKKMAQKWIDPTQSTAYDTLCEIYNHEFQKHGICYNAFEDNWEAASVNYFEAALAVAATVESATQQINVWAKSATPETTLKEIEALFPKKVQVLCSSSETGNQLSAIRSCFNKPTTLDAVGPFVLRDCDPATKSSAFIPCDSIVPISLGAYDFSQQTNYVESA